MLTWNLLKDLYIKVFELFLKLLKTFWLDISTINIQQHARKNKCNCKDLPVCRCTYNTILKDLSILINLLDSNQPSINGIFTPASSPHKFHSICRNSAQTWCSGPIKIRIMVLTRVLEVTHLLLKHIKVIQRTAWKIQATFVTCQPELLDVLDHRGNVVARSELESRISEYYPGVEKSLA